MRLEHRHGVAEVDWKAYPKGIDVVPVEIEAFPDVVNRHLVLAFKVDQQNPDAPATADCLVHDDVQHDRTVFAAGKRDIDDREGIEHPGHAINGRRMDGFPYRNLDVNH